MHFQGRKISKGMLIFVVADIWNCYNMDMKKANWNLWRKDKMDRPITTLFMLMSVDGKISTGATDDLDVDKDFPKIKGVNEGLHQYYEIEQTTDLWSFNSGRVQEKMGVNKKKIPRKTPVSFVVIDNKFVWTSLMRRLRQYTTRTNQRQPGIFSTMVFKVSKVSSIWSTTCLPWSTISVICSVWGCGSA